MDAPKQIIELYQSYNEVIKPLIAEVEARTEHFPLPLFNEIRALHNHIARCYAEGISDIQVVEEQIVAASIGKKKKPQRHRPAPAFRGRYRI